MTLKGRQIVVLGLGITGLSAARGAARHGDLAAAGALLEKPFTADQLARKVREVLAGAA